ncbi:MAG: hypothetical protein ACE1Z4_06420 [Gammaproteobacteria bacterium]
MDLTHGSIGYRSKEGNAEHAGFYLTPKQDDFNQELQVCIAEALYDVDSIVAAQGLTQKKNSRPYTARFSRISIS